MIHSDGWKLKWKELSDEWDKNKDICKDPDSDCFQHYWVEVEEEAKEVGAEAAFRKVHRHRWFHKQFSKLSLEGKGEDYPDELKAFILIGNGPPGDMFTKSLKNWKWADFIRDYAFEWAFFKLSRLVVILDKEEEDEQVSQ